MKPIIYVAHPVTGDPKGNAMRATEFVEVLTELDPQRIYIAPWVAEVLAFGEKTMTDAFYQRVLDDDCEVVARLDGIIGVGGLWSGGMKQERQAAIIAKRTKDVVADATGFKTAAEMRANPETLKAILQYLPWQVY